MIISLDDHRKTKAACVAESIGYLDRSSHEEAMLSAKWTKAELLMQLLDVSWNEAIRIIGVSRNKRVREFGAP
jgi:hypothetical protein